MKPYNYSPHPKVPKNDRQRFGTGWRVAVALLVALTGAGVAWEAGLRNYVRPKNWGVVQPGRLYRSGQMSSLVCERTLERNRIRVVVNLGEDKIGRPDQDAEREAARKLGIERTTHFLAGNGTGPVESYAEAVAAIARATRASKPVLVHCSAGAQRTGGVLAAYQLLVEQKPPGQIVEQMKAHGWSHQDNPLLLPYLNRHMPELARQLVRRGVLTEVPRTIPLLRP